MQHYHYRLCVLVMVVVLPVSVMTQSGTDVKNLITQLFTTDGYNKHVRPLTNQTNAVIVDIDFYLSSIIEFDEQDEFLTTSGFLFVSWTDDYLDWSTTNYSTVPYLLLPQEEIWKPDLALQNTFKSFTGLGSKYLNVRINDDGLVTWVPFQVLTSTCSVDIQYFPFDIQTCEMKFVAWSYAVDEVQLNLGRRGVELDEYSPNSAWRLISTSAYELNTGEASVVFKIKLQRKPLFYLINIVAPVIMLTMLNVANFVLPISSGERAGYSITVFLSLAVFLTIVAAEMPNNSDVVSVMGVYLTLMSSISTVIVILTLVQSRLIIRDVDKRQINCVLLGLHRFVQFFRCRRCKQKRVHGDQERSDDTVQEFSSPTKDLGGYEDERVTWPDVVGTLDILFFWGSLLCTLLGTVIIFMIASTSAE